MHSRRSLARHASAVEKANDRLEPLPSIIAEQSLGYQIRYAYRAFVKVLADELGTHQITTSQWSALRVLWRTDGLSQVELAERMMVEKASLTSVVKAMSAAGLVTRKRNSKDRRMLNIFLTATGRRLEHRILPLVSKINKRATRNLSAAEIQQLQDLLTRVMINLQDLAND
jgi:MarR family transcriptional regulator, organic hydroperoxide resistance regulator